MEKKSINRRKIERANEKTKNKRKNKKLCTEFNELIRLVLHAPIYICLLTLCTLSICCHICYSFCVYTRYKCSGSKKEKKIEKYK